MALSNSEKAKRLLRNVVGAGTSVAVVAAVASFAIRVEASFMNVTVFQNRAFYQLEVKEIVELEGSGEVPEEMPEPVNTPVRLRVQNQWDDFFLPLMYGYNEGFIEPLRPNQQYTLSIELEQAISWSTLDTFLFTTDPTNAAIITEIIETTSPLNPFTQLSVNVLTQNGGTPPREWILALTYGETSIERTLPVGESVVTFENLPHVNGAIELEVFAVLANETKSMTKRVYEASEFVQGDIELSFPTLSSLAIETTKQTTLPNPTYQVRLTQENQPTRSFQASETVVTIDNLIQGASYDLEWILSYQTNENQFKDVVLYSRTIIPIPTPIYVLSVYTETIGQVLEVTIDNDLAIESLSIQGVQNGIPINLPFTFVQETNAAFFYRLTTDIVFEKGVTFALVLTQPAPFDYPITLQTIVFQQGGTNA
jgi:hypothetical protein